MVDSAHRGTMALVKLRGDLKSFPSVQGTVPNGFLGLAPLGVLCGQSELDKLWCAGIFSTVVSWDSFFARQCGQSECDIGARLARGSSLAIHHVWLSSNPWQPSTGWRIENSSQFATTVANPAFLLARTFPSRCDQDMVRTIPNGFLPFA